MSRDSDADERDRTERGEDPDAVVGTDPERPELRDPDPGWQPDPHQADEVAQEVLLRKTS